MGDVDEARRRLRGVPVAAAEPPPFDPGRAGAEPAPLFADWLIRALDEGVPEPQAMTLSTVDAEGRPSSRVLMLRDLVAGDGECGFTFATDAGSRKGAELAARPYAALNWYWPRHGRQIRAAGPVEPLDRAAAVADFRVRGDAARTAAFTGRMSAPLAGPGEYARGRERARALLDADPAAVPERHAVYLLRAREVEFFQLAADRFHRRLVFRRSGAGWERGELWP